MSEIWWVVHRVFTRGTARNEGGQRGRLEPGPTGLWYGIIEGEGEGKEEENPLEAEAR